ncbi:hypothetical protein A2U01_0062045, partial [Trifolium medium]|nr:hypothetical protein [Trifolium medium]
STLEGVARRLIRAGSSVSCSEQEHCLVIPSRIIGSLHRARALARDAEQKGIGPARGPVQNRMEKGIM